MLLTAWNWLLLIFGFGFVIFWHELGHFLAAKWVGIKVEQFAVGFGHAILAWRKGIGVRIGTTQKEYDQRITRYLAEKDPEALKYKERVGVLPTDVADKAAAELGLGETEYRWNWIPLGGYVKMLGQDDLKPGMTVDDPRAYNRKSVGARMIVVSAGVVMNIILAAIAFMVVFTAGLRGMAPIVGGVLAGSPAQKAGIEVGDRIVEFDGAPIVDFAKIRLWAALGDADKKTPIVLQKPDGTTVRSELTLSKLSDDPKDFLAMGIREGVELRGPTPETLKQFEQADYIVSPALMAIPPDATVTSVNGTPINDPVKDLPVFDREVQKSVGRPVKLGLSNGQTLEVQPRFAQAFSDKSLDIAGMQLRTRINSISKKSTLAGRVMPGDAVLEVRTAQDRKTNPSPRHFVEFVQSASAAKLPLSLKIERDGQVLEFNDLVPSVATGWFGFFGSKVLGVAPEQDELGTVVAGVESGSPAAAAGIRENASITKVAGRPVSSWHEINAALATAPAGEAVEVTSSFDGEERAHKVHLAQADLDKLRANRLTLRDVVEMRVIETIRHTPNPATAAVWGVQETRDAVLQVYLTIKRMVQGTVSYKQVSGPLGIFGAGYRFAERGYIELLWFLGIISANLAVMNFLPIPIVDGGLFTFLIIEKIKGGPVSPRVQAVAQVVGLAILLSVFLLATYQDILRLPMMFR